MHYIYEQVIRTLQFPPGFPYLEFVLVTSWIMYAWLLFLDCRQYKKLTETQRPSEIVDIVDQDKFDKAQSYGRDKAGFEIFQNLVSQLEKNAFLVLGIYPWVWSKATTILEGWGYTKENEIPISLLFLALISVYSQLTTLPFNLYKTFVIEERHGFNKQTLQLFFMDILKSMGLMVVIGAPAMSAFVWIIKWGGEHFYVYVWAFVFAFQMLMITIYPEFIQPCFNKVDPLPEGSLRSKIEKLAQSINFPLKKLYQIDGSKRSGHSNAYFYGFCDNKRIVLFDTLMEQQSEEEVVAVLGHELGHWKMMHMPKMLFIIQVRLFLQFFLFGQVINNSELYNAFGFEGLKPVVIGFLLFNWLIEPVDFLLGWMDTILTRMHEFQADAYAVKLGKAEHLKSGLIKLQIENLGNMNPDTWYSTWHYSHPPMVERLAAIEACAQKSK